MWLNEHKEAHRNMLPRIHCRKLEETLSPQEYAVTFSVWSLCIVDVLGIVPQTRRKHARYRRKKSL